MKPVVRWRARKWLRFLQAFHSDRSSIVISRHCIYEAESGTTESQEDISIAADASNVCLRNSREQKTYSKKKS